jgi:hypothetical protein
MILTLCHFIDCTQNCEDGALLLRPSKIAELLSIELVFHLHREGFLLDDSMIAAMAACGVALPSTVTFEEIEEMSPKKLGAARVNINEAS